MTRRPDHPLEDQARRGVHDEIEHYLEERTREFEAQGMSPGEARTAAEEAFGDVERITEQVEHARRRSSAKGRRWRMEGWMQDLRFALRGALRHPGLTAVIVLTLGLGIGATTAIFTVVNASLIRALPFRDADRLVFVQGAYDAPEGPQIRGASYPEANDWAERSHSFTAASPFSNPSVTLTGVDQAERLTAEGVGADYFDIMEAEPLLGRTFAPAEHTLPAGQNVTILGEDLWTRRFGRDPAILGRSLTLNGRSFTVVGVMPGDFPGASLSADLWVPLEASGSDLDRGTRYLGVVARLRPGVTAQEAQADVDQVAAGLQSEFPDTHEDRVGLVTPLRDVYLGSTRTLMLVILSATGLLLIIAAANVTNLLLVRASGRRSEMLVRTALGAGRQRIMGQLVTESLVLAGLGTAAGFALGTWGASGLAAAMPASLLPAYVEIRPDPRVLLFTAVLLAVVGFASGLAPALSAGRQDVGSGLREARPGARSNWSLQQGLVVGEVALAFLLLVGAGLMTRSFLAQLDVRPGFDADRIYAFSLQFPGERYDADTREAAARDILDRLRAQPGVTSASLASDAPLITGYSASYIWTEGSTAEDRIRFYRHHVMPGYFETMGIDILSGRALSPADETPAAVISRAMAERHYAGRNPVGENLRWGGPDGEPVRIVGVADDVRYRDLTTDLVGGASDPDVFLPWNQVSTSGVTFVARTNGDPAALERPVHEAVAQVDPDLAVFNAGPLDRGLTAATAQGRFGTLLLGVFSGLALLLSALGLYGVLAFTVARRTRELAIRVAVGAPVARLRWMVIRQGMRLLAVGLVVGIVVALAATRTLDALLFGVASNDVATYAVVAALLAAIALASTWLPALRATRVDPQQALKAE